MRRFLPSLSALQAFDSAARHLNFTRAAEDLMLTQSGISRQIGNLETYLGVRLFERVGSRLVLTDAGQAYAADVQQALDRLEEVSIDAVRGRKANTALMIGTQTAFASRWLIPRIADFLAANRETPVEITELAPDADPAEAQVDVALLRGLGTWRNSRTLELFREELAVFAAPGLAARIDTTRDIDFRTMPTLQNAQRPSLWLSWLRATGRTFDGAIQGLRLPHSDMVIRAAIEGIGLALLPVHYVERERADGQLVRLFGPPVRMGEGFWLVIPEERVHRENVTRFRNWIALQSRAPVPIAERFPEPEPSGPVAPPK